MRTPYSSVPSLASGPVSVGCFIGSCDSPGWKLQGDRARLVGVAADMVVALRVAGVRQALPMAAGNDAQRAVRHVGVVYGGPHGGAFERVGDLEVGVVLLYS